MNKEVLNYFSEEMAYLREGVHQFAQKYPHLAPYLNTYSGQGADPDMARLLEAFALISSRIRVHQDEQFRTLNKDLLEVLFPHAVAPIPSMSIVQLTPSESQEETDCMPRGELLESMPIGGERLTVKTCYNTDITPIMINQVKVSDDSRTITIQICSLDNSKPVLKLIPNKIRLFINLPNDQAWALYDSLLYGCSNVELKSKESGSIIKGINISAIEAVGFCEDEAMQVLPGGAQPIWRLLEEYFTFREKFLFLDIQINSQDQVYEGESIFIQFHLNEKLPTSLSQLSPSQFLLHCTPVINLFEKELEPISVSIDTMQGKLRSDLRYPNHYDIHSLLEVKTLEGDILPGLYRPDHKDESDLCWYTRRNYQNHSLDEISQVTLLLADTANPSGQSFEHHNLHVRALCFNANMPAQLNLQSSANRFQSLSGKFILENISMITQPTPVIQSLFDKVEHPVLTAKLSHSYLSMHDSKQALSFIRQSLDNADRLNSEENKVICQAIKHVTSNRVIGRSNSSLLSPFVYGTEVLVELDNKRLIGQSLPLLKRVLMVSFNLENYMNSFVQWKFLEE